MYTRRLLVLLISLLLLSYTARTHDTLKISTNNILNGHEWVDLGLSVMWATCNVGASSPSDYGDYYAWGETTIKQSFTEDNSRTYEIDYVGDISGSSCYDVATAKWGIGWRMPTQEEFEELVDRCDWQWISLDGHSGCKVTGPNGNSIFLPAAGWKYGISIEGINENAYYWSSTYCDDYFKQRAFNLHFYYYGYNMIYSNYYVTADYRFYGFSVRPVTD